MLSINLLEKRLQLAGLFLVLGLLIEGLCLVWSTPIAFVIFVAIGGLFMSIGIAIYLYSLVSAFPHPPAS
jgi:uncharacterized membrane protein YczE